MSVHFVYTVDVVSETVRVSKETKEALLRVAARLQERTGRRIDLDEAIAHLVRAEDGGPDTFLKFVGSVSGPGSKGLIDDLAAEREQDELRAKRRYGV